MRTVLALLLLAAVISFVQPATQASADPYRWCADYAGRGGATNCYFKTIQQCRAAISGNGGFCRPNPFYTGDRRRSYGR